MARKPCKCLRFKSLGACKISSGVCGVGTPNIEATGQVAGMRVPRRWLWIVGIVVLSIYRTLLQKLFGSLSWAAEKFEVPLDSRTISPVLTKQYFKPSCPIPSPEPSPRQPCEHSETAGMNVNVRQVPDLCRKGSEREHKQQQQAPRAPVDVPDKGHLAGGKNFFCAPWDTWTRLLLLFFATFWVWLC